MAEIFPPDTQLTPQEDLNKIQIATSAPQLTPNQVFTTPEPTFADELKAGWEGGNIGITRAYWDFGKELTEEPQQDYNPFDKKYYDYFMGGLTPAEIEQYTPNLAKTDSVTGLLDAKKEVESLRKINQTISYDSGFAGELVYGLGLGLGTAAFIAETGGSGIFRVIAGGVEAAAVGVGLASRPLLTGAIAGVGAASAETTAAYFLSQGGYSQTPEEYQTYLMIGAGAGAVVGPLLGKSVSIAKNFMQDASTYEAAKITQDLAQTAEKQAANIAEGQYGKSIIYDDPAAHEGTLSAAGMASEVKISLARPTNDASWMRKMAFEGMVAFEKRISPMVQLLEQELPTGRLFAISMSPTSMAINGIESLKREIGTPVETMARAGFIDLKAGDTAARLDFLAKAQKANPTITSDDFFNDINNALFHNTKASIPEVQQYLSSHWDPMMDRLLKEQQARGYNLGVTKRGEHYYPTHWDTDAMMKDVAGATETFTNAIRKSTNTRLVEIEQKAIMADRELKSLKETIDTELKGLSKEDFTVTDKTYKKNLKQLSKSLSNNSIDSSEYLRLLNKENLTDKVKEAKQLVAERYELQQIVKNNEYDKLGREFVENQIHTPPNTIESSRFSPSAFKSIKLNVDRSDAIKFLAKADSELTFAKYARDHSIAMAEHDTFGDLTHEKLFKQLDKEYAKENIALVAKYGEGSKQVSKLFDNYQQTIKNIRAGFNRLEGRNADGSKGYDFYRAATDTLNTVSTARLMGSGVFSQFSDPANYLVDLATGKFGKDTSELVKKSEHTLKMLSKNDLKLVALHGGAGDVRTDALFNNSEGLLQDHWYGRALGKAKDWLYKLNLMTAWNNTMKPIFAESILQNIMVGASKHVEVLRKVELGELTGLTDDALKIADHFQRFGITQSDLKSFIENFEKHSIEEGGLKLANITAWDREARLKIVSYLHGQLDSNYLIAPGVLTKPLFFDHNMGRLFGLFQGYWMTGAQAFVIKDLQEGSAASLAKFTLRAGLGTLSYLAKGLVRHKWEDIQKDPLTLVYEGVTQGGAMAGMDQAFNIMDQLGKYSGTNFGPAAWVGLRNNRKYSSNNSITSLPLGANAVIIQDLERVAGSIGKGTFHKEGPKFLGKITPLINGGFGGALVNRLNGNI